MSEQVFTVSFLHRATGGAVGVEVLAMNWKEALMRAVEGREGDLDFVAVFLGTVPWVGSVDNLPPPIVELDRHAEVRGYTVLGMDYPARMARCDAVTAHHWVDAARLVIEHYGPPGFRLAHVAEHQPGRPYIPEARYETFLREINEEMAPRRAERVGV